MLTLKRMLFVVSSCALIGIAIRFFVVMLLAVNQELFSITSLSLR